MPITVKIRKKILWILFPVVAAIIVFIKWDSWFYNLPEPPYIPSSNPDRILLTWSGDPGTTRNITWQCDTFNTKGKVQLVNLSSEKDTADIPADRTIIKTSGGAASYYKASIENLVPGQLYTYRVGNENNWSDWHKLKTQRADSSFSFIYIGDVQDSVNGNSAQLFNKSYQDNPDAAFIAFSGDILERPHDIYWNEWFRGGRDLFKNIPVIATPGNHEYSKGVIQEIDQRWMAHFAFPLNGPEDFKGRVCYWDYGNTRFISIDTNGIQSIKSAFDQKKWLEEVLQQTRHRWKVVLLHHPIYSISRRRDHILIRWLFKSLMEKYGVDLVLQGHDHAYGRAAYIQNSEFPSQQGPVYVISHASPKLYDLKFSKMMDRLATNTQMYQVIKITHDSINYRAYTYKDIYYDGFTLHKDRNGRTIITENIPSDVEENLSPTKYFLTNYADELTDYYSEMNAWKNRKDLKR